MSADAMRAHIESLLAQHEIHCRWISTRAPFAEAFLDFLGDRRIRTPRIRGDLTYATALHEIGHLVNPDATSSDLMTREREAWKWARANALKWTRKMERYAAQCLLSYKEAETREAELHAQLAASPAVGSSPLPDDDIADARYLESEDAWLEE
jgi:hypothetical protein